MKAVTTQKLAQTFVRLLDRYSVESLIPAFAEYLVQNRLTQNLDIFVQEISRELLFQKGRAEVTVINARELSHTFVNEIKELIKKHTKVDSVVLNQAIDPSLIGGCVIKTPDWEMDLSLKHTLEQLETL